MFAEAAFITERLSEVGGVNESINETISSQNATDFILLQHE